MSTVAKVYLMVDAELHGPFSVEETRGMIAAGTLTSEGEGTELAVTRSPGIGAPLASASRLPSEILKDSPSFGPVMLDLFLAVLFITGAIVTLVYAFVFETAPGGTENVGRLTDRLVGVVIGVGLVVVVCLIKILRKL